jgi:hypothetical protein
LNRCKTATIDRDRHKNYDDQPYAKAIASKRIRQHKFSSARTDDNISQQEAQADDKELAVRRLLTMEAGLQVQYNDELDLSFTTLR